MSLYVSCSFKGFSMYIVQIQNYWGKMPASLLFSHKLNSDKKCWCSPSIWLFPEWSHSKTQRQIVTGWERSIPVLQKLHIWNVAAPAPAHNVLSEKKPSCPQSLFMCASVVLLVMESIFVFHAHTCRAWSSWSDQGVSVVRFGLEQSVTPLSMAAFSCPSGCLCCWTHTSVCI